MDDDERTAAIEALRVRWSELETRRTALIAETRAFEANLAEVRRKFGNPYYYSHPDSPADSLASYTGFEAHEPGLRLALGIVEVNRDLKVVKEQLRILGGAE
jgi:hypothetical protein